MLSHLKSLFCFLQSINVRNGPVPLNNASSIISERETAIQEPVIGPIRAPVAQFMLDGRSRFQCGPPICRHSIKVFGMYCVPPSPPHTLFSGKPRVVQE